MDLARYGHAFKDRAEARLLPAESAALALAREVGISAGALARWREDAQSRLDRGWDWTAVARLESGLEQLARFSEVQATVNAHVLDLIDRQLHCFSWLSAGPFRHCAKAIGPQSNSHLATLTESGFKLRG